MRENVTDEASRSAAHNKQLYESRARQASIQVEDQVLVRNLSIQGEHKLADCWEENPNHVVECIPGLLVYKVHHKDSKERNLF